MRQLAAVSLAGVIAVAGAMPASGAPRNPRLRAVRSFGLAIGSGDLAGDIGARYHGYDLVVVDGQQANARQVATLRAGRRLVLAYVSVGTIERGRPWYRAARRYRLDLWRDWGEWYADTAKGGYRRLIEQVVAPAMLKKGFDGLFLDNVDMTETHPRQASGMRALVRALSRRVHARHRFLFAQNGEDSVAPLLPALDGWNREDVSFTYDFGRRIYRAVPDVAGAQAALRRIAAAGLLVTATDYTPGDDARAQVAATANACAAGALSFVSDIGLTRIPQPAPRCG